MPQTVRPATRSEVPSIQRLAQETIRAKYPALLGQEMVDAFIDSGQSDREFESHFDSLFVMQDDHGIAGMAICSDDLIHLMMIMLDRHGQGLGSLLLKTCEAMIHNRGYHTARLETFAGNAQAVGFYKRNGWVATKQDNAAEGTLARIWFEKLLN